MTPENLYYLIVAFMALGLLAYSLAISFFQARVEARAGRTGPLPPVSVILPLTGNSPLLLPGLESILAQDYPCFELILVAEDQNDPAWALVLDLAAQDSRVMPVIAGPAEACGQKNRNLLAGLEKIGPASEIVVFTDAEHLAEPDFLAELVAPIVREEAVISSGYHHFLPQEGSLAGSAKAVCVQLLNLTRTIPFLNRPWGGATAVAKKALGDLDLVSLWSVTVVDDVTLARRKGGRRRFPLRMVKPGLATPDQGETMAGWDRWLTRQVAFIKPTIVDDWLGLGFMALGLNLAFFSSLFFLLRWAASGQGPGPALASLVYFTVFLWACTIIRRHHSGPGSLVLWWAGCVAAMIMGLWCFSKTCFSNRISWRGRVYTVGWRGRVKKISGSGKEHGRIKPPAKLNPSAFEK